MFVITWLSVDSAHYPKIIIYAMDKDGDFVQWNKDSLIKFRTKKQAEAHLLAVREHYITKHKLVIKETGQAVSVNWLNLTSEHQEREEKKKIGKVIYNPSNTYDVMTESKMKRIIIEQGL